MAEKKVRLACIASGSGTDFFSIAQAWKNGWIPEVEEVVLISTKKGAGCLEKAGVLGIKNMVVEPRDKALPESPLNDALKKLGGVDFIFLVGCVFRISMASYPFNSMPIYNIHPADPHEHGGQGMYGLVVHEHVLTQILDQIKRGWKTNDDKFYTYPTVHEVSEEYDQGSPLLQGHVEIPWPIIEDLIKKEITLKQAAEDLQKHVLPYEWQILPPAVRMAAKKILDERS